MRFQRRSLIDFFFTDAALSAVYFDLELVFCLVWDQADGALSSAAVPRVGLWPTTPP
jgi:hypothetical protein